MKIKPIFVFIMSLTFFLLVTPIYSFAEIDSDFGGDFDEITTTTTTTTTEPTSTSEVNRLRSGGSDEEPVSDEEPTEISEHNYTNTRPSKIPGELEEYTGDDEESTSDSGSSVCSHNYVIVGFNCESGLATIKCSLCDDVYTDYFANHVTGRIIPGQNPENYDPIFDVVNDGVINGKDYAYLMQQYYDDFSINDIFDSHEFLFKEQFNYIFTTVLTIISTFAICFAVRRRG